MVPELSWDDPDLTLAFQRDHPFASKHLNLPVVILSSILCVEEIELGNHQVKAYNNNYYILYHDDVVNML